MGHPEGESMRMGFEGGIKLEFHGAKVTSDGGLLAYRELDDALGLFDAVSTALSDQRTGRNIQHAMATLLRQSIYSTYTSTDEKGITFVQLQYLLGLTELYHRSVVFGYGYEIRRIEPITAQ